jgi:hypothetical protein
VPLPPAYCLLSQWTSLTFADSWTIPTLAAEWLRSLGLADLRRGHANLTEVATHGCR